MLGDALLDVCSDELRGELEAEANLLIRRYLPSESSSELAAAARALVPPPEAVQNSRARLWAAVLRRRAEIARRHQGRR